MFTQRIMSRLLRRTGKREVRRPYAVAFVLLVFWTVAGRAELSNGDNVALHFGLYTWATTEDAGVLDISEGFTVEALINPRFHYGYKYFLEYTDAVSLRIHQDESLRAYVSTAGPPIPWGAATPKGSVPFDEWSHVAATWDRETLRVFVNGVELRSNDTTGELLEVSALVAGHGDGWWGFGGAMREVRTWNVARSAEEIQATMNRSLRGDEPGLIGYWKMDEGTGQFAYDSSPSAAPLTLGELPEPDFRDPVWGPARDYPSSSFIVPSIPRTVDDLRCLVTVPGFPAVTSSYDWYRDGIRVLEPIMVGNETFYHAARVLSKHFTTKHQNLLCVTHAITETFFTSSYTAPVTIINSTPTMPLLHIYPGNPAPFDALTAVVTGFSTDLDGDEVGYEIRWYRSTDMGETFEYLPILSQPPLGGLSIPPGYALDGEIWRVEVIPFETQSGIEGEMGWDQVSVGDGARPLILKLTPSVDVLARPNVVIEWEAEDTDGDLVSVDLFYDTDRIEGGALPIAVNQLASGSMRWTPPALVKISSSSDLDGDGVVSCKDLFFLASRWRDPAEEDRYIIFARAWARGTMGEAFSDGDVIVPLEYPARQEGILELMRQWPRE